MKLAVRIGFLCVSCVSVVNCFSLDREAFTFTKYDLDVRVEPDQQRLGARGTITLRNDASARQKIAVLQISSSLDWISIKAGGKPLQFVSQTYTSDIDHTGALSEAIVTLPEAVAPHGKIDLEIAYEGVIVLDAARLTRIGTPETAANSSDWDQISTKFTAVRGAGNVTWYPIATEAADLLDGIGFLETVSRWKTREAQATMHVKIGVQRDAFESAELLVNESLCAILLESMGRAQKLSADCTYHSAGMVAPAFVIGPYETLVRPAITVHFLPGHDSSAASYADAAEKALPLITDWFGAPRCKAQTADLPDPNAAPFESGALLLTPLSGVNPKLAGLAAAHQLTHAAFSSPRPWINEGLAHFAQALYVEQQSGRQSAFDYMAAHRSSLVAAEKEKQNDATPPRSDGAAANSLINTADEELYRSKAMYVWWMLRDMVGDPALRKALAAYRAEQDKEPSYLQRLIQAQTQRDLEWFFDDWVYRDRGLPDLKVESAFTRKMLPEGYMTTITVENSGAAGAEVPLTVKFAGGEVTQRLVVRGKNKSVIRVETNKAPDEIVVNDGSVPESDLTNSVFKVKGSDRAE
jgi:hypothetical protein